MDFELVGLDSCANAKDGKLPLQEICLNFLSIQITGKGPQIYNVSKSLPSGRETNSCKNFAPWGKHLKMILQQYYQQIKNRPFSKKGGTNGVSNQR